MQSWLTPKTRQIINLSSGRRKSVISQLYLSSVQKKETKLRFVKLMSWYPGMLIRTTSLSNREMPITKALIQNRLILYSAVLGTSFKVTDSFTIHLMLCNLGLSIVNGHWCINSNGSLTIFTLSGASCRRPSGGADPIFFLLIFWNSYEIKEILVLMGGCPPSWIHNSHSTHKECYQVRAGKLLLTNKTTGGRGGSFHYATPKKLIAT